MLAQNGFDAQLCIDLVSETKFLRDFCEHCTEGKLL